MWREGAGGQLDGLANWERTGYAIGERTDGGDSGVSDFCQGNGK
jgi:hypothetical protein